MSLGRTSCAANAIATSAAAEKNDDVAIFWTLAANVALRSCAYNSTNLHAFCHVAWVVELRDLARSKANLVAVAGITCGRRAHNGALWKLSRKGLRNWNGWVCSARDAHCLVDVAAARKRVADSATDAGSRATKGLNLGWVVVSLVLEEEEPVFVFAVNVHLDFYGTGVDFFRLIKIGEDALLAKILCTNSGHIPKRDGAIFSPKLFAHGEVLLKRSLYQVIINLHAGNSCVKGGVAAVV